MTAPFATLLDALQTRIKTEVPEINWIDQDFGQLENYTDRPPISWPCVLIDFDSFKFEDAADGIQFAEGSVAVRLAFAPYSDTSHLTPTNYKEKALYYYDIEWKLYKALHGWKASNYGYMMRKSVSTERRNDAFRVRSIVFSLTFEDYNAADAINSGQLPPDLEITDL